MSQPEIMLPREQSRTLATNKLIKNTYLLLAMTLAVSAGTALFAMKTNAPLVPWWAMMIFFIGMPFVINAFRNSSWSILLTFIFTGVMGYFLGPILNFYLNMPNGSEIVATATGLTAAIFVGLSFYALSTKKDFSFMSGFIIVGLIVVLVAIVANLFLAIPLLSLVISAAAVLLMSAMILFETSQLVHGGEDTNYVMMTVSIYSSIYVLFSHLLNLVSAFSGE
ncbi:MAG TPA: Bax inhibitor-1/YccA family protein [Chromatiales bacterium]|nr:Bax inhibitor-1/YccA family protein [Thiotrichales bacterium]HIP68804.1 Bax inhibitor-1/YccA family protein [Chromatiales bacterium]